jgi:methylenetetrahydrofolate reductase (NADPH)
VARNPLRESMEGGRFCHVVEIVASRISREARLLEVASNLAMTPGVVAGGITSYAGGSAGQDPVRVGTAARARGLTPNIHVTCVSKNRLQLREMLRTIGGLGLENVFAITGDYPRGQDAVFDVDSVELVSMINEMRETEGVPFWISVAVSPFKYTEPDCAYQYLKLEKKFDAGANFAITQLGYDAKKFVELKRYLDDRGIRKPVLGNVYVLGLKPAEKMSKGEPPGCWVAPELVEKIRAETNTKDKGEAARLERAARMVAILRGLGYGGAYIGGTHKTEHIQWIIKRGQEIAPQWEEFARETSYPPKNPFYMYEPAASSRAKALGLKDRAVKWLFPSPASFPENGALYKAFRTICAWLDRRPSLARSFERAETMVKVPVFGCQECGNCVLGSMQHVCPQTCPKQLRNGPCGGTNSGQCEVIPEQPCIWVKVYERAKAANEVELLKIYIPPPDRSLKGTSAWINYFLNKDSRPGHPKPGAPGPATENKQEEPSKAQVAVQQ